MYCENRVECMRPILSPYEKALQCWDKFGLLQSIIILKTSTFGLSFLDYINHLPLQAMDCLLVIESGSQDL